MKLLKIINSPRAIKWNADCVFKVDNDVILYDVQIHPCEINQEAPRCLPHCFGAILGYFLSDNSASYTILLVN